MIMEAVQAVLRPAEVAGVQEVLRQGRRVLPVGRGAKPALSSLAPEGFLLDLSALQGILAYDPGEFMFTALAGTTLAEARQVLAEQGQYLPFDPPFVMRGATLGGTVAAGLSGSGRYHYGGIRDFLVEVSYVDGDGNLVRAGGKVVKNSAGFDLPKLMVGSLGSLGALVELTFKVFPQPEDNLTLRYDCAGVAEAVELMYRVQSTRLDLDALDLQPGESGCQVWIRLAGLRSALPARGERLQAAVGEAEALAGTAAREAWIAIQEFSWVPPGWSLVKVPLTPGRVASLEAGLAGMLVPRRYSAGAQLGWFALEEPNLAFFDQVLSQNHLAGLVILGKPGKVRLGDWGDRSFYQRVKQAVDPTGRFVEV